MSILSDRDIGYMLEPGGGLKIDPLYEPIQPTSVDLRLGNQAIVPADIQERIVDPMMGVISQPGTKLIEDSLYLFPGMFILGETLEYVELPPHLVGILMGKSSMARIGLQIESAGYVDPGWKGRLTLEIKNLGPYTIRLRPGMLIAQIRFEPIYAPVDEYEQGPIHAYGDPDVNSHYQGAMTVQSARFDRRPKLAAPETPARTELTQPD